MRAYNLLDNGNGGLEWAGLPLIAGWLGVRDVDGLLHRMAVIKLHRAPDADAEPESP